MSTGTKAKEKALTNTSNLQWMQNILLIIWRYKSVHLAYHTTV